MSNTYCTTWHRESSRNDENNTGGRRGEGTDTSHPGSEKQKYTTFLFQSYLFLVDK